MQTHKFQTGERHLLTNWTDKQQEMTVLYCIAFATFCFVFFFLAPYSVVFQQTGCCENMG